MTAALPDLPAGPALAAPGVGAGDATRVRLGASAQAGDAALLRLAADPAVTVRAAVALNPAAPHAANAALAEDADDRVRTLLARKLAGLLPGLSAGAHAALRDRTLAMLGRLVADEAVRVRAAIADVVKEMAEAPRDLVLGLARDNAVEVYDPVIRLSPLLDPADLIGLLTDAPGAGVAVAVAGRPHLDEAVADALAATDDEDAIAALLRNTTASIREATLDALAERAGRHEAWHAPLVRRPRLSDRAARALSGFVAAQLLDALAGRADLSATLTRELRERLHARLEGADAPSDATPDREATLAEVRQLHAAGRLDDAAVLAAIQRGDEVKAAAMLAVAARVPASVVERAATLRSAKGLVSLAWKAGFSMNVAGPLQTLLGGLGPAAVLRPSGGGGFPLAVDEMRWQIDFLTDMGR